MQSLICSNPSLYIGKGDLSLPCERDSKEHVGNGMEHWEDQRRRGHVPAKGNRKTAQDIRVLTGNGGRLLFLYSGYQISAFRTLCCLFFTLQGEFNPAPQDLENVILSREIQASVNQIVKNNTYCINCVLNRWTFQQAMVETVAENYHNIWAKKKKKELDSKGDAFLLQKVCLAQSCLRCPRCIDSLCVVIERRRKSSIVGTVRHVDSEGEVQRQRESPGAL